MRVSEVDDMALMDSFFTVVCKSALVTVLCDAEETLLVFLVWTTGENYSH